MAGSGKRADQRKISILKIKNYFGKHGFRPKGIKTEIRFVNVEELQRFGKPSINLEELGFDKLLSKGKAAGKYEVTVRYATEKAVKKIEAAGGKVTLLEER